MVQTRMRRLSGPDLVINRARNTSRLRDLLTLLYRLDDKVVAAAAPWSLNHYQSLRICIGASKVLRWEDLAHLVESDRAVRNAHAEFVQKSPSTEPWCELCQIGRAH